MFSIQRILDSSSPANKELIRQVQDILRAQFSALNEKEITDLPKKLNDPLKYNFQSRLLVAQKKNESVIGFAMIMYAPDLKFCYLDFMAAGKKMTGQGLGGALYQRVREEAKDLGATCVLMECLPDDPALSPDPEIRKQNVMRIKFYEKYGARVIEGTHYETPVKPEDTDPPYLVIDSIGQPFPDGKYMQKVTRAILERKYMHMCDAAYIDKVVKSFPSKELSLRQIKKSKKNMTEDTLQNANKDTIVIIANEGHEVHHVKDKGYVESPVRLKIILQELEKLSFMEKKKVQAFPDKHILDVHDSDYVSFLKKACLSVPKGKSVYPYVFPIRNQDRKPKDTPLLAGYFCIDTFTPLNADAYKAARSAVDCTLTCAKEIVAGKKAAYALVRPPGHHAERKSFGGFCYFGNAAIAANYMSRYGKVAILDLDYHHGNSQQDIFYKRNDVLTISLHGDPKFAYPYFTGFADEIGEGPGYGYNLNVPLGEHLKPEEYLKAVKKALKRVQEFSPSFLVLALGLDTAKADPTGTWKNGASDFKQLGEEVGRLKLPTLVVQEGGYRTQTLGTNARHFFIGLHDTLYKNGAVKISSQPTTKANTQPRVRSNVKLSDVEPVRSIIENSAVFSPEEIEVAGELVAEAALKGKDKSGYSFFFIEDSTGLLGYSCFGKIPLTQSSFDLYWIVVDPDKQKKGIAAELLRLSEEAIKAEGGTLLYAETSSRKEYIPAHKFYKKTGFKLSARQKDFYKIGDDKMTFEKVIK